VLFSEREGVTEKEPGGDELTDFRPVDFWKSKFVNEITG
jgi:hypothetical protein